MPEVVAELETDAEAKPATEVEAEAKTTDVAAAESSPAETKGAKKVDLLTAVSEALKPKKEKSPDSAEDPDPKPDAKDAKKEGDEAEEEGALSQEELALLKPKTRARMNNLLADRSRLRSEVDALKPKADELDKMVGWFRKSNLETSEVNQLFDVGAKLKNDPKAAYEIIKPIFMQLQQMVGDILPEDLHRQVAQGQITLEAAQELSRARSGNTLAERQRAATEKATQERTEAERHQTHVASVQTAVSTWESSKEKADPDWKLKQPHVMRAIKVAIAEQGYPKTVDDAVKIADQALKDVNAELKGFAPRRKEMKAPSEAGSPSATAKPKTFMEYIDAGLAKGRAAG